MKQQISFCARRAFFASVNGNFHTRYLEVELQWIACLCTSMCVLCVRLYIKICICIYSYLYLSVCVCVRAYMCVCRIRINICICIYLYLYLFVCLCVRAYTCVCRIRIYKQYIFTLHSFPHNNRTTAVNWAISLTLTTSNLQRE